MGVGAGALPWGGVTGSHPFGMGQMGSVAWPPTIGSLTSQPVAGAPIGSQVWQGMQLQRSDGVGSCGGTRGAFIFGGLPGNLGNGFGSEQHLASFAVPPSGCVGGVSVCWRCFRLCRHEKFCRGYGLGTVPWGLRLHAPIVAFSVWRLGLGLPRA